LISLEKEHVGLCVSIDGPEHVHDLKRCYKNGKGSFVDTLKGLREALKQVDYVQVNAVFGPETVEFLPETVSLFTQLGARVIEREEFAKVVGNAAMELAQKFALEADYDKTMDALRGLAPEMG